MRAADVEIIVRGFDLNARPEYRGQIYGAVVAGNGAWMYEAYDGTERRMDSYASAADALYALLAYLEVK